MAETTSSILASWSNFYLMTGSAAAALTGLMFVVITLIPVERLRRNPEGISTFNTPTIAHFGMALFVSAVLNAPWRSLASLATLLVLVGSAGVTYVLRVMFRTRRLSAYSPDLEDWAWYSILPFVAYAAIMVGAIMLYEVSAQALFAIAGGVLLLIFIGIHNAWDIVTYIAIGHGEEPPS